MQNLAIDSIAMAKQDIVNFLQGCSVEVTPTQASKVGDFREHLTPGQRVMVTFLPGSDWRATVETARMLREQGFEPAPHIAARSVTDATMLEEFLKALREEAGVREVLAIGGGVDRPVGKFDCTMQMLETGLFQKYGIFKIGVAGHPEGSPDIPEAAVRQAIIDKNRFAEESGLQMHIATQFCFEVDPILDWERKLRADGNKLPIYVGIAGLATLKTLMAHAKACGVGNSIRVLMKQAANITKLMTVREPGNVVVGLAREAAADPESMLRGAHFFPLGGLRRTAAWMQATSSGAFDVVDGGHDIALHNPID
jgi:methylenetetrahydrofolate reductase (NADPH)